MEEDSLVRADGAVRGVPRRRRRLPAPACSAARLRGIVFHLLRHESLSRYAERGLDPLRLQLIGGHRDLRHVARYVKLSARGLARG